MSRHAGYPLPWSVQTWLPGTTASHRDPAASVGFARDLAAFIAAVRTIAVGDRTFSGSGRSGHLPSHDAWMDVCFAQSEALLDVGMGTVAPALRKAVSGRLPMARKVTTAHSDGGVRRLRATAFCSAATSSSRWRTRSASSRRRGGDHRGQLPAAQMRRRGTLSASTWRVWYCEADTTCRREPQVARHIAFGKAPDHAAGRVATVDEPNAWLVAATRDRADLVVDVGTI